MGYVIKLNTDFTVEVIESDKRIFDYDDFCSMRDMCGADIFTTASVMPFGSDEKTTLLVDDEGLLKDLPINPIATAISPYDALVGDAVLVGVDGSDMVFLSRETVDIFLEKYNPESLLSRFFPELNLSDFFPVQ